MKAQVLCMIICGLMGIPVVAQAMGPGSSGGGDAVACVNPAGGGKSVALLDYYEAQFTTNLKIDLGPNTSSYMDRVNFVLNRLDRVDPWAAEILRGRAKHFISQARFISPEQMKALADFNGQINPAKGCRTEQFAIQNFDLRPDEARYLINRTLWDQADSETRAGLVLHEVIYYDAHEHFKQSTSDNTRYYNAEISSAHMNDVTLDDYQQILQAANFAGWAEDHWGNRVEFCEKPAFTITPNAILPKGAVLFPCSDSEAHGTFQDGVAYDQTGGTVLHGALLLAGKVVDLTNSQIFCNIPVNSSTADQIKMDSICQIALGYTIKGLNISGVHVTLPGNYDDQAGTGDGYDESFNLGTEGIPTSARVEGDQSVRIGNAIYRVKGGGGIQFYSDGHIAMIVLAQERSFVIGGQYFTAAPQAAIDFRDDGSVSGISDLTSDTTITVNGQSYTIAQHGGITFHDNDMPKKIQLVYQTPIVNAGAALTLEYQVEFYDNGMIKYGYLAADAPYALGSQTVILAKFTDETSVQFYKSGKLKSAILRNDVPIEVQGQSVTLLGLSSWTENADASFYEDGSLAGGVISIGVKSFFDSDPLPFRKKDGSVVWLQKGREKYEGGIYQVELDQNGNLSSNPKML